MPPNDASWNDIVRYGLWFTLVSLRNVPIMFRVAVSVISIVLSPVVVHTSLSSAMFCGTVMSEPCAWAYCAESSDGAVLWIRISQFRGLTISDTVKCTEAANSWFCSGME